MSVRISQFRQKLIASPNNQLFRYSLAQSLFEEGQTDEAIIHFLKCLELRADWMLVALYLGKAYMEKKDFPKAEKYLELTINLGMKQDHIDPVDEAKELLSSIQHS